MFGDGVLGRFEGVCLGGESVEDTASGVKLKSEVLKDSNSRVADN